MLDTLAKQQDSIRRLLTDSQLVAQREKRMSGKHWFESGKGQVRNPFLFPSVLREYNAGDTAD